MGGGEIHITDAATRAKLLAGAISRWDVAQRVTREHDAIGRMGITIRDWRLACRARPVRADAHLAICHEMGIDPVRCAEPRPAEPYRGPMHWPSFGIALGHAMAERGHSTKAAAAACGVSTATISRAAGAGTMCFEAVARIAAYIGRHPHFYTHTAPGCSTGNTHCNALKTHEVSHA